MTYQELGSQIGALVDKKQEAYGDSVGKTEGILLILFPNGIPPAAYKYLHLIIHRLDKFFRMASNPEGDLLGESPWQDVAGYALLGMVRTGPRPYSENGEENEETMRSVDSEGAPQEEKMGEITLKQD